MTQSQPAPQTSPVINISSQSDRFYRSVHGKSLSPQLQPINLFLPTSTCAIKPPISPEHRLRLGSGWLLHSTSQNKPLICGVFGLLDSPNFHLPWRSRVLMSSGWQRDDTVKTLPCPPTAWHPYLPGATVHTPFFNFESF